MRYMTAYFSAYDNQSGRSQSRVGILDSLGSAVRGRSRPQPGREGRVLRTYLPTCPGCCGIARTGIEELAGCTFSGQVSVPWLKNVERCYHRPLKFLVGFRPFLVFRFLHGVIMRLFLVTLLLFTWSQNPTPTPRKTSKPQQQESTASQQPTNTDQRGTEQSPLVVKTLEPAKSQAETEQEAKDRQHKATNDGWIVILTAVLAVIAFGQLGVYLYQAKKLRETVQSAGEQSKAMERHIGEAARSATAMEQIVGALEEGNQMIMRAYVSVVIGAGTFQERNRVGQADLMFDGKVQVVNTGNTPARKVRIRKNAAILLNPIPDNFAFPLSDESQDTAYASIAPHRDYIVTAVVPDFVPDGEVAAIKEMNGKALCVWGVITYEDVFGETHTTKFGQQIGWLPNQTIYGFYIGGHNEAD